MKASPKKLNPQKNEKKIQEEPTQLKLRRGGVGRG
jgi:hypothetical protein